MTDIIPINLAVEDVLSEEVINCIFKQSGRSFSIGTCYRRSGSGYLKKTIKGFNNAAKGTPFLVLTDLDNHECPIELIRNWLPMPKHDNLIFRIAVREVESWLLAHRLAFSEFLGVSNDLVPRNPDEESNPKQCLINLVRRSRKTTLRNSIVPKDGSTAIIGPDYNGKLIEFLKNHWNVQEAVQNSPSLERTFQAILNFAPVHQ